jgi:predicted transcriptional regulator
MISVAIFIIFLFIIFMCCIFIFPSKKYLNDIYQEMYLRQQEQNKMMKDLRNVFFAKNRKSKKEGK